MGLIMVHGRFVDDMSESFLGGRVTLHCGDCRDVLPRLAADSIDSCVTDPPYDLKFMGKDWDGTGIAFRPDIWREVYRVLKPGAHLLAFGGTRTYHRMACAIEDAGFEIRDCVLYLYGSGFPKSHDVSKGIDRAAGAERGVKGDGSRVTLNAMGDGLKNRCPDCGKPFFSGNPCVCPKPDAITPAARQWEGFGTALKPACELIVLARKPLSEKTVAANVLKWGTGALNINGCRVGTEKHIIRGGQGGDVAPWQLTRIDEERTGRFPANVIHDGSEEVVGGFPEAESGKPQNRFTEGNGRTSMGGGHLPNRLGWNQSPGYLDSGSAARFFYTAKADSDDRLGSKHPTVKPLDLMQYLVRLVTPPKGTVLDLFAGTGSTGEAAYREGMSAVLIEREAEYQDDIRRRMKLVLSGPEERNREAIKHRTKDKPVDHGPLFEGYNAQDDFARSIEYCYEVIRARKAAGGKGWPDDNGV